MAEQVDLTEPEVKTNTRYELSRVVLDYKEKNIEIVLEGANGEIKGKVYNAHTSPTGQMLLNQLNTANLSSTSLVKRIYNRLLADGVIAGTVSGTPT